MKSVSPKIDESTILEVWLTQCSLQPNSIAIEFENHPIGCFCVGTKRVRGHAILDCVGQRDVSHVGFPTRFSIATFTEEEPPMAKFYVECGRRWIVVEAMDAEAAAMHWMDSAMKSHLWIYDDAGLSDGDRHAHLAVEALLTMAPEICVSEQGLGREDALKLGTPEVLLAWHRTLAGLNRLLRSAGLPPRSLVGQA